MKALLRWLTSITDMPQPCQSVSSSRTCSRTSTGSVAGPAAKLSARTRLVLWGRLAGTGLRTPLGQRLLLAGVQALDALDADQALPLPEADEPYALGVASLHGDLIHGGAHQRTGGTVEHDLRSRHVLHCSH